MTMTTQNTQQDNTRNCNNVSPTATAHLFHTTFNFSFKGNFLLSDTLFPPSLFASSFALLLSEIDLLVPSHDPKPLPSLYSNVSTGFIPTSKRATCINLDNAAVLPQKVCILLIAANISRAATFCNIDFVFPAAMMTQPDP